MIKTEDQEQKSSEFYNLPEQRRIKSNSLGRKRYKSSKITRKSSIVTESSMRLHRCKVCNERFHRKDELTKHLIRHTQDNTDPSPPSVDQSNEGDNSIENILTGDINQASEKPYACTQCSYRFKQKNHLVRHLLIHSGEKPFACTQCSYRCNRKDKLSTHMRSHAGYKPSATPRGSDQSTKELTQVASVAAGRLRNKNREYLPDINVGQDNDEDSDATIDDSQSDEPRQTPDVTLVDTTNQSVLSSVTMQETEDQEFVDSTVLDTSSSVRPLDKMTKKTCRTKNSKGSYCCKVCYVRFHRKVELVKHRKCHTQDNADPSSTAQMDENKFFCTLCEFQCRQRGQFSKHMLTHTGEKPYLCATCSFRCSRSAHLARHMLRHSGEKPFLCTQCPYRCNRKDKLSAHVRSHHTGSHTALNTDPSLIGSDQCAGGENLNQGMPTGKLSAAPEKSFHCVLCSYQTSQKGRLYSHLRSHKNKPEQTSGTDLIDESNKSVLSSDSMLETEDQEPTEQHTPDNITRTPSEKSGISLRSHRCRVCGETFRIKDDLMKHLTLHLQDHKKPFLCAICPYRCIGSGHLAIHMRKHTDEKPFLCTLCPYRCSQSSNLVRHMRRHNGEKPYACTMCPYRSCDSSYLAAHMRSHTGEKPFACTLCSYRCSRISKLPRHMLTHTGEKPFACRLCTQRYSQSNDLNRHMLRHAADEKPFACTLCVYRCSDSGKLSEHMFSHTG